MDWPSLSKVLEAARALPMTLLAAALAIFGAVVIAAPHVGGLDLSPVRHLPWFGPVFVFALIVLTLRLIDMGAHAVLKWHRDRPQPTLNFTVNSQMNGSFWSQGQAATQISVRGTVFNPTDAETRIVGAHLIRPRVRQEDILPGLVTLSDPMGGNLHSPSHPILPRSVGEFGLVLFSKRPLGRPGKFLSVTIGLVDHTGEVHRVRVRLWPTPPPG